MSATATIRLWLARDINALVLAGAVALLLWPLIANDPYSLRLLTLAGIYALAAIGYQFILGHAGALSLAQGAFFGLGAYVAGILAVRTGAGFEVTLPAAMLAAAALAAIVALPVLRLQSHYFALATLAVGQAVLLLAVNWESVTGGANGIAGVPALTLFGWTLGRGWPMLVVVWTVVGLSALLARRLTGGLAGPVLACMREQPMAAAACGIDTGRLRFAAFVLSALYGGAAGALQVHTIRVVSPEVLEFPVMITLLAIVVIGGRTSIAGVILAAVLLVHLPEWFRVLDSYYLLAYGVALLAMIVAAPWGLAGAARRLRRRILPEPDPAMPPALPAPARASPARLEIAGLKKHFGGVRAVDGIDLAVAPGEALGIVGANGSGKTTLLNLVAGAETPDSGSIRLEGAEIAGLPPRRIARAGIARTFQMQKLVDGLSALDNVAAADWVAAASWRGWGSNDLETARSRAMGLLERLGVAGSAWRPAATLPPGVRRRVEIARALIGGPALLLLDEPAAGLTGAERKELAAALAEITRSGVTLIVVEHDLAFLTRIAGRLVCLERGRIIADGPPETVRASPAVIESWLGRKGTGDG